VLDFGLAKAARRTWAETDATVTGPATRAGMILGTAAYMSPEQASAKPVEQAGGYLGRLGVVLWELLTGHRLFEGETPHSNAGRSIARPIELRFNYRQEIHRGRFAIFSAMPGSQPKDPSPRHSAKRESRFEARSLGESREAQSRRARVLPWQWEALCLVAGAGGYLWQASRLHSFALRSSLWMRPTALNLREQQ